MSSASTNPRSWKIDFALVVIGTLLMATAFFQLLPVLPLLVVGPLGKSEAEVGLVVGTFSITALAARPFSGFLLDRFGRRIWLIGATVLMIGCMEAYAWVHSLAGLLTLRLVHGLFWGLATVAMATVAADLVPARHRGTGMGLYGLAMPMAMSIGPLLGSAILRGDQFRHVFWTSAALSVLACVCYIAVRVPGVRDLKARLEPLRMFERNVLPTSLVMTLMCAGIGGWMSFMPLYAPEIGLQSAGPIFFWYAVGGLVSRVFAGRWYDLRGPLGPGLTAVILVTMGWLGFFAWQASLPALVSSCLLGLGFGTAGATFLAMAIDLVPPSRRGAANATFFSSYDVGIGGGAMIFGLFVGLENISTIFATAALCSLAAGGVLLGLALPHFKRHRLGV